MFCWKSFKTAYNINSEKIKTILLSIFFVVWILSALYSFIIIGLTVPQPTSLSDLTIIDQIAALTYIILSLGFCLVLIILCIKDIFILAFKITKHIKQFFIEKNKLYKKLKQDCYHCEIKNKIKESN